MTTGTSDWSEDYAAPRSRPGLDRFTWLADFREDLARYRAHQDGSRLKPWLIEQGVWALLQYRVAAGVYRSALPAPIRQAALLVCVGLQQIIEIATKISLPYRAQIGPGLYLGHFGPILVNADAVIGAACNLSPGVTIGVSGRGSRRGVPTLGDRIYVGANAVICGPITVADGAVVGANSMVNRDVPAGATVLGVPAVVVSQSGTTGMGLHQHRVDPLSPRGVG